MKWFFVLLSMVYLAVFIFTNDKLSGIMNAVYFIGFVVLDKLDNMGGGK